MPAAFTAKVSRLALVALWLFLLSPMLLYPLWCNGRGWSDPLYLFNAVTSVSAVQGFVLEMGLLC